MSSKLYKQYLSLKKEDPSNFYIFKTGVFYIFISDDATKIAPVLNLKLTNLNSNIVKCGFPISSAEKYFKKFDELNLNVKVVSCKDVIDVSTTEKQLTYTDITNIINNFLNINIDNLSISQAYNLLYDLQNKFSKINL